MSCLRSNLLPTQSINSKKHKEYPHKMCKAVNKSKNESEAVNSFAAALLGPQTQSSRLFNPYWLVEPDPKQKIIINHWMTIISLIAAKRPFQLQ